jgi:hypothetical protein
MTRSRINMYNFLILHFVGQRKGVGDDLIFPSKKIKNPYIFKIKFTKYVP